MLKDIIKKLNPKRIFSFLSNRGLFNFIPDEQFLLLSYKMQMGHDLDLNKPETFNQKLRVAQAI